MPSILDWFLECGSRGVCRICEKFDGVVIDRLSNVESLFLIQSSPQPVLLRVNDKVGAVSLLLPVPCLTAGCGWESDGHNAFHRLEIGRIGSPDHQPVEQPPAFVRDWSGSPKILRPSRQQPLLAQRHHTTKWTMPLHAAAQLTCPSPR